MQTKIKLAICYFMPEKKYLKNELCIPIQLGPSETGVDLGIYRDDIGDNRSDKHPYYSEYSGIYWLWKNTNADYKGMFHHRRFLTTEKTSRFFFVKHFVKMIVGNAINFFLYKPFHYQRVLVCKTDDEYFCKVDSFLKILPKFLEENSYDIVVPQRYKYYHTNVYEAFDEVVNRFVMKILKEIIRTHFSEYANYFQRTLSGRKLYYSNIHIMKNEVFDNYCNFTFSVFDLLEECLQSEGYYLDLTREKSMSRVFGYIGELLMNTFVLKASENGMKIKELPLLFNASANGNENICYKSMSYHYK